jgi:hypothetical protein
MNMENKQLAKTDENQIMHQVITAGDLEKLSPADQAKYYMAVCKSVGLNPFTKPFDLIKLGGKLVMYANRGASDQLRSVNKISITISSRVKDGDLYIVTARATTPDGRSDESTGVVSIAGAKGDILANAYLKAETKAKRRVTLSIVGLGWLDETEVETIPGAQKQTIDLPPEEPARITVIGTDQRSSFPQDPEKPKPENLTEEDMQLLQKTMNECEINKQDVMHFCHTEFKKPFLAITQDEFKKLLEALKLIK